MTEEGATAPSVIPDILYRESILREKRKDSGCPITTGGHDRGRGHRPRIPATPPLSFPPPPLVIPDILYRESILRGKEKRLWMPDNNRRA